MHNDLSKGKITQQAIVDMHKRVQKLHRKKYIKI